MNAFSYVTGGLICERTLVSVDVRRTEKFKKKLVLIMKEN